MKQRHMKIYLNHTLWTADSEKQNKKIDKVQTC